ncbi:hypothetical protein SMACR_12852 [Sordaria macrospora]|uniref:Uncharacterized protein n=1 Tax=Sordaria macrospora TaxID=5147 RepID=A0A8S8ZUI9_SORMA|nr:hypothetical protein SMACR_12852 [Sordaria macrospora]WPJ61122.1 hypothetical protein SMAC4_13350 [Sordaria macrospora]
MWMTRSVHRIDELSREKKGNNTSSWVPFASSD